MEFWCNTLCSGPLGKTSEHQKLVGFPFRFSDTHLLFATVPQTCLSRAEFCSINSRFELSPPLITSLSLSHLLPPPPPMSPTWPVQATHPLFEGQRRRRRGGRLLGLTEWRHGQLAI